MALDTPVAVASVRRIDALNFIETASPPASSKEELIRNPLDSRFRLFWRLTFVLLRLYEASEAAELLLMLIISFLCIYCSVRAALGPLLVACLTSPFRCCLPKFICFYRLRLEVEESTGWIGWPGPASLFLIVAGC